MVTDVNVLGTRYTLSITKDSIKELEQMGCDGFCDQYHKELKVRPIEFIMVEDETADTCAKKIRQNSVILHELIHAHLFEAGLREYSEDETLVEALTVLIPKIYNSATETIEKSRVEV